MSAAVARLLDKIGDNGARRSGDTWLVKCPAHEDNRRSLAIKAGDRGAVLKCHAGCEVAAIAERLGLKMGDLFDGPPPERRRAEIVNRYPYRDERGALLYEAVRLEPKDFRQRRPNGNGWTWQLGDVRRVLYRLPELVASAPRAVFVVEGEKDVETLEGLGLVATTNAGGAGKWRKEYGEALKGRPVFVLPDNDEPGRTHAALVAKLLEGVAASVRIVNLPGLPAKGDVSDWVAAGGTREALMRIVSASGEDPITAQLAKVTEALAELARLVKARAA